MPGNDEIDVDALERDGVGLRLQAAVEQLRAELHLETIQILATRAVGPATDHFSHGAGNFFARICHCRLFAKRHELIHLAGVHDDRS